MNKEVKEMSAQVREILDKYPNRQKEILCYIFGEDTIREIIGKPTYEELQQKVKHLEANWDELKGWLKANDIHYAEAIPFRETLNKMQELERGKEDV